MGNERNRTPKATREEIERMKRYHKFGWSVRMLADKFGYSKSSIQRYLKGISKYDETIDPAEQ
jgi:IS30 family transposase